MARRLAEILGIGCWLQRVGEDNLIAEDDG